jgi:hypothetical protein
MIIRVMRMEKVPETSIFNHLTRLIAWEDFINVSRCESFRSYIYDNITGDCAVVDKLEWFGSH